MQKIYLIQQTTVFNEKESHEWSPVLADSDLDVALSDLKSFRVSEESNRLTRLRVYNDVCYKVYYKIDEISLF